LSVRKWVYKTVPSDLKVLHLGKSSIKPPKNVTVKKVSRLDMPKWYSKCKVGIVCYKNYDSCPRVISEMLACGLPLIILDNVNYWYQKYDYCHNVSKHLLWLTVLFYINEVCDNSPTEAISEYYKKEISIKPAAEHLRKLIRGK